MEIDEIPVLLLVQVVQGCYTTCCRPAWTGLVQAGRVVHGFWRTTFLHALDQFRVVGLPLAKKAHVFGAVYGYFSKDSANSLRERFKKRHK
jgi:hypothetical protein